MVYKMTLNSLKEIFLHRNISLSTQVCYVRFPDIKQNGGRLRGTIIFSFDLRSNVSRLSENSQDGI